jgi:ketosteroid isomerase-like protein
LVNERDQAVGRGDTAAIDRIYADDYVATSASGLVRTKAQVIEDFKTGALKIESITSDEINVRVHGDTAIVTGRMTTKGLDRGRDVSGQNRFTQVYLRRNGRWQITAFHYSRIGQ